MEKIATIITTSRISVQGVLIADHGDGKASVRIGEKVYTGTLVGKKKRLTLGPKKSGWMTREALEELG